MLEIKRYHSILLVFIMISFFLILEITAIGTRTTIFSIKSIRGKWSDQSSSDGGMVCQHSASEDVSSIRCCNL